MLSHACDFEPRAHCEGLQIIGIDRLVRLDVAAFAVKNIRTANPPKPCPLGIVNGTVVQTSTLVGNLRRGPVVEGVV